MEEQLPPKEECPPQRKVGTVRDILEADRRIRFNYSLPSTAGGRAKDEHQRRLIELHMPTSIDGIGKVERERAATQAKKSLVRGMLAKQEVLVHANKTISGTVLAYSMSFLPSVDLRRCVVVCQEWRLVIKNSVFLSAAAHKFEFTGTNYDDEGIIYYIGTHYNKRSWINPSRFGNVALLSSETRVWLKKNSLEALVGNKVSHFSTAPLPFSWVAVDFINFSVCPTHYTIGTSTSISSYPTSWQLLGYENSENPSMDAWLNWVLLDEVRNCQFFSPNRLSATFPVKCRRNKFFRYLRIIQIAANQQFGHDFTVSGLEFYGSLKKNT